MWSERWLSLFMDYGTSYLKRDSVSEDGGGKCLEQQTCVLEGCSLAPCISQSPGHQRSVCEKLGTQLGIITWWGRVKWQVLGTHWGCALEAESGNPARSYLSFLLATIK